ncbi:MAG TPA: hypothetical protein VGK94_06255 [Candidatus Polarisedimenticolia bacterium]|jgi:hypothetical protein
MRTILALSVSLASISHASAWGFAAHRIVTENAAAATPAGMTAFYKAGTQRLSDASIEPDSILKDRDGEREKRRHYIDLDELSSPPFRDLPFDEEKARAAYGDARVDAAGTLPWRILTVLGQLRDAFRKGDVEKIISRSGWLSHYVADAYQPLHTTKNHDGQETCNEGVHLAFETDMIDLKKSLYRAETAVPASFVPEVIKEPRKFIFTEILGSYELVDDVLSADTQAVAAVKKQRKSYYEELERQVGPLARRQMSRATATVINLWYTAWFTAGRPELPQALPARGAAFRGGRP